MDDKAYVEWMKRQFEQRQDPRLFTLLERLERLASEDRYEEAKRLISELIALDERLTLEDMLMLTGEVAALRAIHEVIRAKAYRGAACDIDRLIREGKWQPNKEQEELIRRFGQYFAG
ncbi:MAG: hypothetical protein ACFLMY_14120 [Candidatus Brachytrichaceae bacterium NZ_4S206]|jgi:nucleoside-diphosphate-sugar epimerase